MKNMETYANPEFYTVGGTLKPTDASYIVRAADKELLAAITQSHAYCYVLSPRQMGRSSLMVRTAKRLQEVGTRTVIIDLTSIGTTQISAEQWYLGQIHRLVRQLGIQIEYVDWWQKKSHLSVVQRFVHFLREVVLHKVAEPIVIFIDEIDTILSIPKEFDTDDYFTAIRALYNERAIDPSLERLTFVLLGVFSPSDLIKDTHVSPFNIGRQLQLTDFTRDEVRPLVRGLAANPDLAEHLLTQIFSFTGGHPYLTQKMCRRVAQWAKSSWNLQSVSSIVGKLVEDMFISEKGRNTDDNLQMIQKRILNSRRAIMLLQFYRHIRSNRSVRDNNLSAILAELKLSGLVKADTSGVLIIRNPIYERVFDEAWIDQALLARESQSTKERDFLYDVWISYSHRDRTWVEDYLLPHLNASGLKVWLASNISPGANLLAETERAISKSRYVLAVISPDSVGNAWSFNESSSFLSIDIEGNKQRFIPILLKPTKLPPSINRYKLADFTQEKYWDAATKELIKALEARND